MSTALQDTKAGDTLARTKFGGDVELLTVIRTTKTQVIVRDEYGRERRYMRTGYPVGAGRGRGFTHGLNVHPARPEDFTAADRESAKRAAHMAAMRLTEALQDRAYDHGLVVARLETLTEEVELLTTLEHPTQED